MDLSGFTLTGRFVIKDKEALCKALNITNLAVLKAGIQFVIPKSEVFNLFRNSIQVIQNADFPQNDSDTDSEISFKHNDLEINPCETIFCDLKKHQISETLKYQDGKINIDTSLPVLKIRRCDDIKCFKKVSSKMKSISPNGLHLLRKSINSSAYMSSSSLDNETQRNKTDYEPFATLEWDPVNNDQKTLFRCRRVQPFETTDHPYCEDLCYKKLLNQQFTSVGFKSVPQHLSPCIKNNKCDDYFESKLSDTSWPILKMRRCDDVKCFKTKSYAEIKPISPNGMYSLKKSLVNSSAHFPSSSYKNETQRNKNNYEPFATLEWDPMNNNQNNFLSYNKVHSFTNTDHLYCGNLCYKKSLKRQYPSDGSKRVTVSSYLSPCIKIRKCDEYFKINKISDKRIIWEYKADTDITFRNYISEDLTDCVKK